MVIIFFVHVGTKICFLVLRLFVIFGIRYFLVFVVRLIVFTAPVAPKPSWFCLQVGGMLCTCCIGTVMDEDRSSSSSLVVIDSYMYIVAVAIFVKLLFVVLSLVLCFPIWYMLQCGWSCSLSCSWMDVGVLLVGCSLY